MHWKRVHRMLTFASIVSALLGVGWVVFAMLWPNAVIMALSFAAVLMAATNICLMKVGKVRVASYVYITTIYFILVVAALFIGVLHQFLLPLSICAFLLMRNENLLSRHGIPIVCLATFGFFSCLPNPVDTVYLLPSSVRGAAVWIDQLLAVLTLYVCLQLAYEDVLEQSKMELELRDALIRNELMLLYQPQVHASGHVVGVEALVRWKHPTHGLVPPNNFIPVAEATGLMVPIGDWVLRTACSQLAVWQSDPHFKALTIAVNVSASQFAEPNFVERVVDIVQLAGAKPSMLKLELTESMFVANIDDIVEKMISLKQQGISLSLDDFGTGFSSLAYLRRLPLDQLKIDQSFIKNMLSSAEDASIAKTVIALGNDLKLEVIAEGVETHQHRKKLDDMGCQLFQGYLFSKPVTGVEVEQFVLRVSEAKLKGRKRQAASVQPSNHEAWSTTLAPSWWVTFDANGGL
ncbi:MAG: EAL domain-containing protein [Cytophagaceae bacterium]|nr:MAG: EAL domain-containing protein [Cytophagaceae bacterium]